jgi:hypothetical protein
VEIAEEEAIAENAQLSWPKNPSAQGSAGQPRWPKGVTRPEQRVFESNNMIARLGGVGKPVLTEEAVCSGIS